MTDQNLASAKIQRRILSVEQQMARAEEGDDRVTLERLRAVRQAYLVDLMDILNEENVLMFRRRSDTRKTFSLVETEKWVRERSSGDLELAV